MAMQYSENVDRMDVRYVAGLARMALTDEETTQLQSQLDDILAFVGELKSLDVEGVEATNGASGNLVAWREDEPKPSLSREAVLSNAPLARNNQFVVPKVIE
jgi:aspartyl-tRNA(Asn)/glutamyl-tRNA(Gln) amidotransferase subunit C